MKRKLISTITLAAVASSMALGTTAFAKNPTGDGEYHINDAILIYQFLGGNYKVSDLTALDYNKNGVITEADGLQIQHDILYHCTPDPNEPPIPKDSTTVEDQIFNETERWYSRYDAQTGIRIDKGGYSINCAENYFDNGISTYDVIGDRDDRVVDFSKTGVVKIITDVNDVTHFGTGFIVGPHTIATAAHVVYNDKPNDSAKIEQILSFNADGTEKSGTITPLEIHLPTKFNIKSPENEVLSNEVLSYDYALITVEEDLSNYPFFELGVYDSISDRDVTASITGFPTQVQNNITGEETTVNTPMKHTMYTGTDVVFSSDGGVINHKIDTTSGNSGIPLYITEMIDGKAVNIVFSIHNLNDDQDYPITGYNHAVQINSDMIQFFKCNPHVPE